MLTYYRVEFYTGVPEYGPFIHVLARDPQFAAIVAQAHRIEQGNTDLRIEHVWEDMDPAIVERLRKDRGMGVSRVIPDPKTLPTPR